MHVSTYVDQIETHFDDPAMLERIEHEARDDSTLTEDERVRHPSHLAL